MDDPRKLGTGNLAIPDEEMTRILDAVRRGHQEQARQLIAANPTEILRDTHERQKLTSAVYMQAAMQVSLEGAWAAFMRTSVRIVNALEHRLATDPSALTQKSPEDLLKLAERLRRVLDPAIKIAMATEQEEEQKTLGVTQNTINVLMQGVEAAKRGKFDPSLEVDD